MGFYFYLDGNTSLEDVKRIMTSIYKNTTDEDIFYLISELESFDIIENIDEYKNYEYNNPKMLYFSNFTGNSKDILDKVDKACLFIYGYNEISIELIRNLLEIGFQKIILLNDKEKIKLNIENKQVEIVNMSDIELSSLDYILKDISFVLFAEEYGKDTQKYLIDLCNKNHIAFSFVYTTNYYGFCGPIITSKKFFETYLRKVSDEVAVGNECVSRINLRFVNPSFQPLTNVVVAVQITEMLKYITGFSYPKTMNNRFVYDSFSHENEFQKI